MLAVPLYASEVALALNADLIGSNVMVNGATTLIALEPNCICYINSITDDSLRQIEGRSDILALTSHEIGVRLNTPYIRVSNPRLAFAKVLSKFFSPQRSDAIEPTAKIAGAIIGYGVYIGCNVVLEDGVVVDNNSTIMHNVVVCAGSRIGRNCLIKPNSTIGAKGFGFERDEEGVPIEIPHLGGVIIGDNVEVGSNNTIVAGTINPTIIGNNVKLDDHVHIAHNVIVGDGTLIAACAEISGSVKIGSRCWLGPNCSIKDGIKVGNGVFIGIGSVVTKSIPDDVAVAGNPARLLVR